MLVDSGYASHLRVINAVADSETPIELKIRGIPFAVEFQQSYGYKNIPCGNVSCELLTYAQEGVGLYPSGGGMKNFETEPGKRYTMLILGSIKRMELFWSIKEDYCDTSNIPQGTVLVCLMNASDAKSGRISFDGTDKEHTISKDLFSPGFLCSVNQSTNTFTAFIHGKSGKVVWRKTVKVDHPRSIFSVRIFASPTNQGSISATVVKDWPLCDEIQSNLFPSTATAVENHQRQQQTVHLLKSSSEQSNKLPFSVVGEEWSVDSQEKSLQFPSTQPLSPRDISQDKTLPPPSPHNKNVGAVDVFSPGRKLTVDRKHDLWEFFEPSEVSNDDVDDVEKVVEPPTTAKTMKSDDQSPPPLEIVEDTADLISQTTTTEESPSEIVEKQSLKSSDEDQELLSPSEIPDELVSELSDDNDVGESSLGDVDDQETIHQTMPLEENTVQNLSKQITTTTGLNDDEPFPALQQGIKEGDVRDSAEQQQEDDDPLSMTFDESNFAESVHNVSPLDQQPSLNQSTPVDIPDENDDDEEFLVPLEDGSLDNLEGSMAPMGIKDSPSPQTTDENMRPYFTGANNLSFFTEESSSSSSSSDSSSSDSSNGSSSSESFGDSNSDDPESQNAIGARKRKRSKSKKKRSKSKSKRSRSKKRKSSKKNKESSSSEESSSSSSSSLSSSSSSSKKGDKKKKKKKTKKTAPKDDDGESSSSSDGGDETSNQTSKKDKKKKKKKNKEQQKEESSKDHDTSSDEKSSKRRKKDESESKGEGGRRFNLSVTPTANLNIPVNLGSREDDHYAYGDNDDDDDDDDDEELVPETEEEEEVGGGNTDSQQSIGGNLFKESQRKTFVTRPSSDVPFNSADDNDNKSSDSEEILPPGDNFDHPFSKKSTIDPSYRSQRVSPPVQLKSCYANTNQARLTINCGRLRKPRKIYVGSELIKLCPSKKRVCEMNVNVGEIYGIDCGSDISQKLFFEVEPNAHYIVNLIEENGDHFIESKIKFLV